MGILKAFSRLTRTNIITNSIEETSGSISASTVSSMGYTYYVYTAPAEDNFSPLGSYAQNSRTISGGSLGASPFGNADILVVAGGGGGGGGSGMGQGGGGGAGGVRYFPNVPVPSSPVSIQVGYGGTPIGSYSSTVSGDGQPSFFGPSYISYGGGGGGSGDRPVPQWGSGRPKAGQGGSGGGAGTMGRPGPPSGPGPEALWAHELGQGNIPPFSPPQGFPGDGGYTASPATVGGGGGASQAGGLASPAVINAYGGDGAPYPAFPAPVLAPAIPAPLQPRWTPAVGPTGLFGGGGGGGRAPGPNPSAFSPGGDGGGGNGSAAPPSNGQPGATYTGGGGGGGIGAGGQGGSGVIIIRK